MMPGVGTTCAFTFTPRFVSLNGVYRVSAETTFDDAIASNVDFVGKLYTLAGLSSTDFATDYTGYKHDAVAVLESVIDTSVVMYVPESVFATVPDPTVREYYPLVMVVDLGVQRNTQMVLPLINQVKDQIQATLGSTDPVSVITDPTKKVYLTDAEYEILVTARDANIQVLAPLSVQLKAAQDQITLLAAKVAAYEDLIKNLPAAQ